jgi:hypothetical protein
MNRLRSTALLSLLLLAPAVANADSGKRWPHGRGNWSSRCDDYRPHRGNWNNHSFRGGSGWSSGRGGAYDQIIYRGARTGLLSYDEERELRDKARDLRREERAFWSDGRLSPRERKELREGYEEFRGDLRHELNDGERARRRWYW